MMGFTEKLSYTNENVFVRLNFSSCFWPLMVMVVVVMAMVMLERKQNGLTPPFYGFIRDGHVSVDQPPFMNHINYDDNHL